MLPVMVASPTSFALVGLKDQFGTGPALFTSGMINAALWFTTAFLAGKIGVWLRRGTGPAV
jgi:hypothetical protein